MTSFHINPRLIAVLISQVRALADKEKISYEEAKVMK